MAASHDADVLVVGAGISGLLCASSLQAAGRTVRVVEKSRGVGGRMATRRIGEARFDHGVQFFSASQQPFMSWVELWLADGLIKVWQRPDDQEGPGEAFPRYCGIHGMTDVPKHLAAGLTVHLAQRANVLEHADAGWCVHTEQGECFRAPQLVITSPLPQSLDLLDTIDFSQREPAYPALRAVNYVHGLALLACLDGPSGVTSPGYCEHDEPACHWIADNQMKGISPEPCVTVHALPSFAAEQWDLPPSDCMDIMLRAAAPHLGGSKVTEYALHRWRYAVSVNAWPKPFFKSAMPELWLAGDGFGGGQVERAACSGLAVAEDILGTSV